MSGRSKRGRPKVPGLASSPGMCAPPASPLIPDNAEESYIMREEGWMKPTRDNSRPRSRSRPRGTPPQKTRVNAQSKLKSPIKPAHSGTCTDSCSRENASSTFGEQSGNLMGDPPPYGILVDDTEPSYAQSEAFPVNKHTNNMEDNGAERVCAFCNCGSEVRMVQGKLQKYAPTPGFDPFKKAQSKPQPDDEFDSSSRDLELEPSDDMALTTPIVHRRGPGRPPGRGRRKGHVVVGLPLTAKNTTLGLDKTMFGTMKEKDVNSVFEEDGSCWAHHCCASWSQGVCQTDSYDLVNVDKALFKAMTERCSHCNRFGASVNCSIPRCNKVYHYPCAASSGSFQDITKMMTMLCPDHLQDAVRLAGPEAECVLCGIAEDIPQMLFCTSCGRHYHGRCLDPPVEISSLIRMGWQCPDCKVCQGCRQPGDDNRMLVCDVCDKGYHIYCLDPKMTTIPKTGWKCMGCRRCADCGSNQPGGGPTSRWHRNYTVCDSCYQQRNKGLYCPLCGRAYRQFTDVAMMKCEMCEKWIHAECDNIDMDKYRTITDKHLPYHCPTCKIKKESPLNDINHESSLTLPVNDRFEDVDSVYSQQSEEDKRTLTSAAIGCITPSPMDEGMPIFKDNDDDCLIFDDRFVTLGDEVIDSMPMLEPYADKPILGKLPLDEEMEIVKPDVEIFGSSSGLSQSPPPVPYGHPLQPLLSVAKVSRSNTPTTPSRVSSFTPPLVTPPKSAGKRKLPGKMKGKSGSTPVKKKAKHGKPGRPPTKNKALVNSSPGKENLSGTANTAEVTTKEETETEGLHSTPVLFSAADEFLKTQDMCLCCGSFGRDTEGQLIVCSQCGQCYHPYCVGVKVNKVILSKGWRCLDCTLCEGCGKGSDEARLLLCDNCDISYHTYCLDPPLDHVPQGGWKCKWCVCCHDCNATNPGFNSEWMSNYTQCGPCASFTSCPVCKIKYAKNDLMIKCIKCDRWLHGSCDGLMREEELEMASESGYHCLFCRPKTNKPLIGVSGPPSPRATALHHYHPQLSDGRSVDPNAKPLHPCQRMNNSGGVIETTLKTHFTGLGVPQFSPMDSVGLTDSGVRQMNSLKISARVRKAKIKNKVKPKKFAPGQGSPQKKVGPFSPETEKPEECLLAFTDVHNEGAFVTDLDKKSHVLPKVNRSRANARRPGIGGFVATGRGTGARKFVGHGGAHGFPWKRGIQRPLTAPRKFGSLKKTSSHQESVTSPQDNTSNDSWSTGQETEGLLEESYPDWLQEAFFGKNLLDSISKKKGRRNDGDAPSTPSEDGEKPSQEPFGEDSAQGERFPQHEQAPYQQSSAQSAYPARPAGLGHDSQQQYPVGPQVQVAPKTYSARPHQSSSGQHHANMGLDNHDSWHVSSADPIPTDALNLSEDIPNPDVLYSSLDIFTDDEMSGPQSQSHSQPPAYTHSQAKHSQQHQPRAIQAPVQKSSQSHLQTTAQISQAHVSQELPVTSTSSWSGPQAQRQQQNNVLDLLCSPPDTLPHVHGHEVEEIFAGLEIELNHRDTSVMAPGLSGRQDPFISGHPAQQVSNRVTSAESSITHPATYAPGQQTMGPYHQGAHTQGFVAGAIRPSQFEGAPQRAPQGYGEFIPGQENAPFPGGRPTSQPMHGMEGFPSSTGMGAHQQQQYPFAHEGPSGMFPPIHDEFGLTEDLPKERRRPPSPRVDPQKQQQKWHDDEKLGVMATISPVLYANIEHPNLSAEFPEWTNRYRAIARLWRKLSVEQREPFRLKARDNRVKLKDQGKRLAAEAEKREKEKREQEKEQKKAEEQQQQEQLRQELNQQQQQQGQLQQHPVESECSNQSHPEIPLPARQMSVPTPPLPPSVPDYVNVGCVPSSAPLTPSTPAIPASPATPMTPMTPMTPAPLTPTTPTFPGKFPYGSVAVPAPRVTGTPTSDSSSEKGGRGRKTGGKAAKSKEDKEREKELRKERLRVQQEKERQWKLLQQKRQLENQRQTQQHQQENILMRQELRRTQQTKSKPLCEETKKKVGVKKTARRPSMPNNKQGGTLGETSEADQENSTPEEAVLTVLQEGDARVQGDAETPRSDSIDRNQPAVEQQTSEPISISSREIASQPIENNDMNRPLSRTELDMDQLRALHPPPNPMNNGTIRLGEEHPAHQQQSRSWTSWPEKAQEQIPQPSGAIWSQQQHNSFSHQQQQSNEQGVPSQLVKESQPELRHQTSWHQKPQEPQEQRGPPGQPWLEPTQQREGLFPDTSEPQQAYTTQEQFQRQQQQQQQQHQHAWQQRQFELEQQQQHAGASGVPPVSHQSPFRHPNQGPTQEVQHIPEQPPTMDNMGPFQPRQHNVDMDLSQEQRTDDTHLQQGQPLSHWQHDPTSLPSQVGAQALPQPQHQSPLQGFRHSDGQVPHAHASNMSGAWPHPTQEEVIPQMPPPIPGPPSSQPQPLPLQHLPQSQAQHPVMPVPQQPIQQLPVGMMRPQVSTPHSAPQVPAPPPPPPLSSQPAQVSIQQPIIPPLQNLPHDDPQQIELIQQQHREQLLRIQQQQQLYQLQVQQHQLLQQQQQQGGGASVQAAVLPVSAPPVQTPTHQTAQFARPRAPQFVSPKDMPEIESEEEHQERLRFLYKQRQAQKQQQLQSQVQQQIIQQQLVQGMVPGVIDPSNPQTMQQLAQIRPQFPELMQQQMLLEYQRRMTQRQGLGQQTIQYDKVVQEFQQRQGGQLGGQQGPVLDLPHQRFAVRPPAPGIPPGLQQGQVALYGLDPTKQQQLYQMQLQQQQQLLLQQQQQQRKVSSDQHSASHPSSAPRNSDADLGKEITVTTETVTKSSRCTTTASKNHQEDHDGKDTTLQVRKVKMEDEAESSQETMKSLPHVSQTIDGSRSDSSGVDAKEDGRTEIQESTCQYSSERGKAQQLTEEEPGRLEAVESVSTATKELLSDQKKETVATTSRTQKTTEERMEKKEEDTEKETVRIVASEKPKHFDDGSGNSYEKGEAEATELSRVSDASVSHQTGSSEETLQQQAEVKNNIPGEKENGTENKEKEPEGGLVEKMQEKVATPVDFKMEKSVEERKEDRPLTAAAPQIRPPQPKAGKSVSQVMLPTSQPQQQVVHQQLMGLGHQFSMMQQQQAVYMQQYQALQQQFTQSQGQNAAVGQNLVALHHQAQMLQQQMIQCWQQIQILQQQLQGGMMPVASSNPQQQLLQQQQLLLQVQQAQHPAQGFPKEQVLHQQGVPQNSESKPPIKSPNPQKVRKPRRSKSRDTPTPQASPLPGQGVPPDWVNQQPQGQKPQSKPRGRRPKKSQSQDPDPEMQMKQQLLQQQLLQQMEISHRLRQQQQQDPVVSRAITPHQTSLPPPVPETSLPQPQQRVGPYQSFHESPQLTPGLQVPLQQVIPQHVPSEPQSQVMTTADVPPPHSQSYAQGLPIQGHPQDPRQGLPLGHPQRPQQGLLVNPQGFPHGHPHSSQGHLQVLPQAHPQGQQQEHPQVTMQSHPQGQLQSHSQSHPQSQLHDHHQGFPQGKMQSQVQGFPQVHQQVQPPLTSADSFKHMFPTPDHYLKYMQQQQADQKRPLVQYVAHANNPFSDEFMEIQRQEKVTVPSKAKGTKGTKKRGPRKDSASKVSKTPSTPTTPTTPQTPSTPSKNLEIPSAMPELKGDIEPSYHGAQWQPSLESAPLDNTRAGDVLLRPQEIGVAQPRVDLQEEQQTHGAGQSYEPAGKKVDDSGGIEVSVGSKESLQQNKDRDSKTQNQLEQSTPKEPQTEDVKKVSSSGTAKVTAGGIDALQKLECMVADMASEEEACKEIESSLQSVELELDEENMLKTPPPEVDVAAGDYATPSPKRRDPESQASSISLECHEQTLTSPPADSRVTSPTTEGFPRGEFGVSEQQLQVNNVIQSSGGFSVRSDIDEQMSEKSKPVVTNNTEQYRRAGKMDGDSAWTSPEQRQTKSPFLDSGELFNAAQGSARLNRPVAPRDSGIDLSRESVPIASSKRPAVGEHPSETRPVITMEDVLSEQPIGTELLPSQFQGIPIETVRKKVSRSKDSKGPGRPKSSKTDSTVAANKKRKEERKRLEKMNEKAMQMEWKSLITAEDSKIEQDEMKKLVNDQRRQEYERKRKEYEEQQRRKRELQKELRQQKMLIKEQQKKKKLLNLSRPKMHNPEDVPAATKSEVASELSGLIKSAATLSLCEPKLILTHALMHPYGSSPLNGHCVLKGSLGKATIDGIVDVYAQYPTPELEGALCQPPTPPSSLPPSPHSINGKLMVNGDVSAQRRAELLSMVGRSYARVREVNRSGIEVPHKRSCYMEKPVETVPASMPSPPLSDNINPNAALEALVEPGTSSAAMMASARSSLSSSLSPSPETVQYVASSSPESDAVNRQQTPKYSALNRKSHRESMDSPTFPRITEANIKRENLNQYPDAYRTKSCELESRIMEMRLPHSAANVHLMQNSDGLNSLVRQQSSHDVLDADLDSINVTLTLSPTSEQQVSERVASVADLIGCSPPRPSDIVIEPSWKPPTSKGNSSTLRNRSFSSGGSRASSNRESYNKEPLPFSHFDVTRGDGKASQKKPDGPYCRHCDVLVIGIGVTRHPDEPSNCEQDSSKSLVGPEEYKIDSVNVQAGDTRGDVFCSEACLKQYFSHVGSRSSSPLGSEKLAGKMSSNARSEGHTSAGLERLGDESVRGNSVAKGLPATSLLKVRRANWKEDEEDMDKASKRPREQRWRRWKEIDLPRINRKHELNALDVAELLAKHGVVIKPGDTEEDTRTCIMCGTAGDGETEGPARLLNSDADEWVHLNCALWSLEVYETLNGALMNVEAAVKRGTQTSCCACERKGATIVCTYVTTFTKTRCSNTFHFGCALKNDCIFFKDKTMLCHEHRPKDPGDHRLPSYAVFRKVFVYRNEIQQIASMLRHNQENSDKPRTLRVGSLVIKSLGQLLPYQLQTFHTRDAVYPVGFKSVRMYWSLRRVNKRCEYNCVVEEVDGKPSFTIRIQEDGSEENVFRGKSPTDAWIQVLQPILKLRKEAGLVNLFSQYITGEDLFGVTEPFVLRIIESMPGVDQMQGYNMRYGRSAIMELPLAINPTGCARSEPLLRTHFRSTRAHALRTASSSQSSPSTGRHAPRRQASSTSTFADDVTSLYTKQFVHSKASQYRKLKTEWRNNVFLGRSNIQGLGLFANRDLEPHSMVIEYIGHIIRNEVANKRERIYENAGRGVYMFRIDSDAVIDATVSGAPARYINHSCMPNCVAEVVTFEREQKIIIISNRKVEKGEELTYDYKFDFEDDDHKIPCLCGASNCRKWMN